MAKAVGQWIFWVRAWGKAHCINCILFSTSRCQHHGRRPSPPQNLIGSWRSVQQLQMRCPLSLLPLDPLVPDSAPLPEMIRTPTRCLPFETLDLQLAPPCIGAGLTPGRDAPPCWSLKGMMCGESSTVIPGCQDPWGPAVTLHLVWCVLWCCLVCSSSPAVPVTKVRSAAGCAQVVSQATDVRDGGSLLPCPGGV